MKRGDPQTDLEPWIDRLLDAVDESQADRILVEAALASGAVEAAALWRPFDLAPSGPSNVATWWCVVARGLDALLPKGAEVQAVASGDLSGESLPGRVLLCAGVGVERCVLALGGIAGEGALIDWVEAMLQARVAIMHGLPARRSSLDRITPALPAPTRGEHQVPPDSPADQRQGPSATEIDS